MFLVTYKKQGKKIQKQYKTLASATLAMAKLAQSGIAAKVSN